METNEEWTAACDAVVAELLSEVEVAGPPVDALAIAERLRVDMVWDAVQTGRARRQELSGRPLILVRPDDRPERVQWAVAHELGEQLAERVTLRLGLTPTELLPRQREQIANQLANRILLPEPWFAEAHRQHGGNLLSLKTLFATASYELVGWRCLDRPGDRIVTVCDQGQVSRRRSNFAMRTPPPLSAEVTAWSTAHETAAAQRITWPGGSVRVWPIHEPAWKREIAVTEIDRDCLADANENAPQD